MAPQHQTDAAVEIGDPHGPVALDGLRLLRAVQRRRWFRRLLLLAPWAYVAWTAFVLAVQAWTPDGSSMWNWAGDHAGKGYLVVTAGLLVGVAGFAATSLDRRPEARTARRIRPLAGAAGVPVGSRTAAAAAFVELLNRRSKVSFAATFVLVVALGLAVGTAVNAFPAWQGAHGHGGPVYRFGTEATLDHVDRGGRTPDYFLSTPSGVVLAEDGRPHTGQRWTVVGNVAYRVGGYTYVLIGLLFLVGVGAVVGTVVYLARDWRKEARRRAGQPHASAADALTALQRRHEAVVLSFGVGVPPARVGFDRLHGADVRGVLLRRRLVLGALGVAAATGLGLWVGGVFTPPPKYTYRKIPALTAPLHLTGYDEEVQISRGDRSLFPDFTGKLVPQRAWGLYYGDARTNVQVRFYRMRSAADAAGGLAPERAYNTSADRHPTALAGLPAGWVGAVVGDPPFRRAVSWTVAGRVVVEMEVIVYPTGDPGHEVATPDAAEAAAGARTAAVIQRYGVARLAAETLP